MILSFGFRAEGLAIESLGPGARASEKMSKGAATTGSIPDLGAYVDGGAECANELAGLEANLVPDPSLERAHA
jgi:hypothetical protein